MNKTILHTATPEGNLVYGFRATKVKACEIMQYADSSKYMELCRSGCPNYGRKWSCPPYAPPYQQYVQEFKYLTVCVLFINLSQFLHIKNDYLKVKAANTVLKSRIDKALRTAAINGTKYISTGSCRLCKPCRCKAGEKCAKPDKMGYSFEALGIDVNAMTVGLLSHELLWYKKGHYNKAGEDEQCGTVLAKGGQRMKSCGYDLLVQVDERLLNKALSGLFYSGALKKSGTYSFINGIPEELLGFTRAEYRIRLRNEPYLDFLKAGTVGIRGSVEVILKVLGGVRIEIDTDFGATAEIRADTEQGRLIYDLAQSGVYDIHINDCFEFHQNTLDSLTRIMKILIGQYLTKDVKEISLPVSMVDLQLPDVPAGPGNTLPVRISEVSIADGRYFNAGINFFDHVGGDPAGISDLAAGAEFAVALKTDALKSIAGFWWERTEREKRAGFDGSFPINAGRMLAKGKDLFLRAITLGILQPESEVKNAALVYEGSVELLELPGISFAKENKVVLDKLKLKLSLQAHLNADISVRTFIDSSGLIPDKLTPWSDDKLLSEKNKNESFLHMDEVIGIEVEEAVCSIDTDEKNRLVLKVVGADLELELGEKWYQNFTEGAVNTLLGVLEKTILGKLPPIVISPSLLLADRKIMGYTLEAGITDIVLSPEELVAAGNVTVKELSENAVPMPLYIANRGSMKLHRFDCGAVEDIDFAHRAGYHGVYEAVQDGYKPCGECLKGYPVHNG